MEYSFITEYFHGIRVIILRDKHNLRVSAAGGPSICASYGAGEPLSAVRAMAIESASPQPSQVPRHGRAACGIPAMTRAPLSGIAPHADSADADRERLQAVDQRAWPP